MYEDIKRKYTKLLTKLSEKSIKNGKALGPGNLNIELIKAGPRIIFEIQTKIFDKCIRGN